MSRYRGPRVRIVRSLGALPGLTHKAPRAKPMYGSSSSAQKKGSQTRSKSGSGGLSSGNSNRRGSEYCIRLAEKQRLRFHYGLTERQLLRYVRIARRAKGSTGEVLLQLLEMRLDNTVFRLGVAPTVPAARQLISHGHVQVGAHVVDIPSYRCKPQDVIAVRDRARSRALVQSNLRDDRGYPLPSHLTLTRADSQGKVNHCVSRDSVGLPINELLVVEYYSRQA